MAIYDYMGNVVSATINSVEPADTDIPIVFFTGTMPTSKNDGKLTLKVEYYSRTKTIKEWCTLKVQGDSSAGYPKKNYNMVMYKDDALTNKDKHDFKGWGKSNKFCLKANWIDHTHARNVVNAQIYGQMCATRSDYALYPERFRTSPNHACIDGFPVKVYANGVYQGLYTWNIAKDKFMSNMDDENETDCMLIADSEEDGVMFAGSSLIDGTDWTDELHDEVPAWVYTSWGDAQDFVMNSSDTDFVADIESYFYLSSLIDRYIFSLAFEYIGGFAKSQAYYTYDGVKWLSSMYDLDTSWALNWDGASFLSTSLSCPSQYEAYKNGKTNTLIDRLIGLFPEQIKARYTELRLLNRILSDGNIMGHFEHFMAPMAPLYEEDYASTTAGGAYTNIPSKTTNNMQTLRQYVNERLAYADTVVRSL